MIRVTRPQVFRNLRIGTIFRYPDGGGPWIKDSRTTYRDATVNKYVADVWTIDSLDTMVRVRQWVKPRERFAERFHRARYWGA